MCSNTGVYCSARLGSTPISPIPEQTTTHEATSRANICASPIKQGTNHVCHQHIIGLDVISGQLCHNEWGTCKGAVFGLEFEQKLPTPGINCSICSSTKESHLSKSMQTRRVLDGLSRWWNIFAPKVALLLIN